MQYLVTGAGGFLGRYIVEQLVARGDSVRALVRKDPARGAYPYLEELGVEMHRGDLADRVAVDRAVAGVDCVMHVGGKVGVWGHWFDYFQSNVQGTLNLLGACQDLSVPRFVFTSSPSVTFDGRDQENVNEQAPYPTRWLAHYPHSKAVAEDFVLSMNGQPLADGGTLRTCSLRPHLVWGPRDHHLTARLIERARSGQLRRVGEGTNLVDTIYVENAADAHLLAADALADPESPAAGNAYFLSQGEPVGCWQWIDEILALVNLPPVEKSISERKAYLAGRVLEEVHRWTGNAREPRMTRFVARSLATHHWFDISAARRDLGYQPRVSTAEGMQLLGQWLSSISDCGMRKAE